MSIYRILSILLLTFVLALTETTNETCEIRSSDVSNKIFHKFEVYESILNAFGQTMDQEIIKIQDEVNSSKTEEPESEVCVEFYGDFFRYRKLKILLKKRLETIKENKEFVENYFSSEVSIFSKKNNKYIFKFVF